MSSHRTGGALRRAAAFSGEDSCSDGEDNHAGPSRHDASHSSYHHSRSQEGSRSRTHYQPSEKHRSHRNGSLKHHGEAITGFSSSGAELAESPSAPKEPIVIPALPDVDFRAIARQRRQGRTGGRDLAAELGGLNSMRRDGKGPVVPAGDSSLHRSGGTHPNQDGTRDRIGDEEQQRGLITRTTRTAEAAPSLRSSTPPSKDVVRAPTPTAEDADEMARRALLASASGNGGRRGANDGLAIPLVDEEQVLRDDVDERPEAPTLETYAAIPVEGFGAAMLRGMGWREGMGAGRNRDGPTESIQVKKRPELLGLGAKERQLADANPRATGNAGASGSTRSAAKRPERPTARGYMPVVRREAEGSADHTSGSRSGTPVGRAEAVRNGEGKDISRSREYRVADDERGSRWRSSNDTDRYAKDRAHDSDRRRRDADSRSHSDRRDRSDGASRGSRERDRDGDAVRLKHLDREAAHNAGERRYGSQSTTRSPRHRLYGEKGSVRPRSRSRSPPSRDVNERRI